MRKRQLCIKCSKFKFLPCFSRKNVRKGISICKKCTHKYWRDKTGKSYQEYRARQNE